MHVSTCRAWGQTRVIIKSKTAEFCVFQWTPAPYPFNNFSIKATKKKIDVLFIILSFGTQSGKHLNELRFQNCEELNLWHNEKQKQAKTTVLALRLRSTSAVQVRMDLQNSSNTNTISKLIVVLRILSCKPYHCNTMDFLCIFTNLFLYHRTDISVSIMPHFPCSSRLFIRPWSGLSVLHRTTEC